MNVQLIKMQTGEDVVAELIRIEGRDNVVIRNPIVMVPQQGGQVGFGPWSPFLADDVDELSVSRSHVVYISDAKEAVVENYKQIFSPIITPGGSGKIIT